MSTFLSSRSCVRAATIIAALVALAAFAAPSAASIAPPAITSPADGAASKPSIQVKGTGAPGATVEVFDGATSLGTTVVAGNGGWALPPLTFTSGTHTLTATATDGPQTSAPSSPVTVHVDGTRPTISIGSPGDDHVFRPGEPVHLEGSAADTRALSAVRLEFWRLGTLHKAQLADCTCSGATNADWTSDPELDPGEWTLKAFAVDQANNYSLAGQISFVNGSAGVELEQPDLESLIPIAPPEILDPEEGKTLPGAARPISIGGATEPGSTVSVYEHVQGIGWVGSDADSDEDGAWRVNVRMPTGRYGIRAAATDEEGNVSELSELIVFTVDGERPLVDVLTTDKKVFLPLEPVVLEGAVSDNFDVAMVLVEYFDMHGKSVLKEQAECTGCFTSQAQWRHEPSLPFGPGHYTAKVTAFDVAGNGAHNQKVTFVKTI